MTTMLALIPARAGSLRIKNKNVRYLSGHPLMAYTIAIARSSGIFDRILVSTNSEETRKMALYYGAEAPFLRPEEYATSTSPDIEWIKHAFSQLKESYDAFCILRPTSPFRTVEMLQRAKKQFLNTRGIDSLRAVELCAQHPGKMWQIKGEIMEPLLDQSHLEVPWHAGQYQALPKVYVQNSSLEMAWSRVVKDYNSREGKVLAPFLTDKNEGFSLDYEREWDLCELMIKRGDAKLPEMDREPYKI